MPRFCFLFVLTIVVIPTWSQEDSSRVLSGPVCPAPFISSSLKAKFQIQGDDADGITQCFSIIWIRDSSSRTDTFLIRQQNREWTFLSLPHLRFLKDSRSGAHRAMAAHHLREPILGTLLRYDDLELLAKGLFLCRKDSTIAEWFPAYSNTWFRIRRPNPNQPDLLSFTGYRHLNRQLLVEKWDSIPGLTFRLIPVLMRLESGTRRLRIRLEFLDPKPAFPEPPTATWSRNLD